MLFGLLLLSSCGNRSTIDLSGLKLETLDGIEISIDEFKDEVVFLHFWATWCPPCRKEMPSIIAMANELDRTEMRFLMVSEEESKKLERFDKKYKIPMEMARSTRNIKLSGIIYIPQTYIIKHGKIVESFTDEQDWSSPEKLAMLKSYLVD